MKCPYCEQEMQQGILSGDGRTNVTWKAGDRKTAWFDSMMGIGKLTAVKQTLTSFSIETFYCEHCRKMIFETDIQK